MLLIEPVYVNRKMQGKATNRDLGAAKAAKQDEFYTQYVDIQKEVESYLEFDPDTFHGKVVYCNCDDPFESNFFKYFAANFNKLGLKKLITTSYDGSPHRRAGRALPGIQRGQRQAPKAQGARGHPRSCERRGRRRRCEHRGCEAFPQAQQGRTDKDAKRAEKDWQLPNSSILVLSTPDCPITDMDYFLEEYCRGEFEDNGFTEIWLADHSETEAYGAIELFCLHPPEMWGHYARDRGKTYG
jgi:hypothetical protein